MIEIDQHRIDFYGLAGLLFLLFALAPLYFQPNLGGIGLELTFNIATWAVASAIVFYALMLVTQRKTLRLPRRYLYFISVPVVIIVVSTLAGTSQPVPIFFRQLFIIGGLFFLFALFQFRLRQIQIEWLLLIVVLATLTHSILGGLQVFDQQILGSWYATRGDASPRGVFQQINVQATYLATGIAIAIYLLSRPMARQWHPALSALVILSIGLSSFVILYSGSRVGLISVTLSLLLLFFFRRRQLGRNKILLCCAIFAIAAGSFAGKAGLESSVAETSKIAGGTSRELRLNMYAVAFELIEQKPVLGHGIGNFLRVWNLQSGDYAARNPSALMPPYVLHPHNELIYWMIEGGLVIVLGIMAAIVAVLLALIRCGPARGVAYLAMLLPITFHNQVELPFYISAPHWFLWLLLIFVVMRHQVFTKNLATSVAADRLIQASSLVLFVGTLYFLQHTARAQADLWAYINQQQGRHSSLQIALNNHYFYAQAEEIAMRASLYNGAAANSDEQVRAYIQWSNRRLAIQPDLKLFEDLIYAYTHLGDDASKCEVIKLGARMYPRNQPLKTLTEACLN